MARKFFSYLFFCLFFSFPAFASEKLIIALDADMSAVAKEGGQAIQRGAEIAIDEINELGGILGRQLELKIFDHRGNPARGVSNIKKIAAIDNVLAVLGGVHTPVVLKELPHIHEHSILFMAPWSAGTPIIDNGYDPNFVFRVSVRDQEAAEVLVGAAKENKITKIALLLEKTGWGRSNLESMVAAAQNHDIYISTTQWINWKQTDMSAEIDAIARSGAEAIMLVANAPEGAVAVKEISTTPKARALHIYSHWGLAGGNFVNKVPKDQLANLKLNILQSYSFARPSNEQLNKRVLAQYKEKFSADASATNIPGAVGVAHSYDIVYLLKAAAEAAQSTDSNDLRIALENIKEFNGLVKTYSPPFTANRHDALWSPDYFLSKYDHNGHLIPIN